MHYIELKYLLESYVRRILSETLPTRVETILSDQAMSVTTYPTVLASVGITKWRYAMCHTYQLLDPGPYFLGWLYHTLLCPITGYSHKSSED